MLVVADAGIAAAPLAEMVRSVVTNSVHAFLTSNVARVNVQQIRNAAAATALAKMSVARTVEPDPVATAGASAKMNAATAHGTNSAAMADVSAKTSVARTVEPDPVATASALAKMNAATAQGTNSAAMANVSAKTSVARTVETDPVAKAGASAKMNAATVTAHVVLVEFANSAVAQKTLVVKTLVVTIPTLAVDPATLAVDPATRVAQTRKGSAIRAAATSLAPAKLDPTYVKVIVSQKAPAAVPPTVARMPMAQVATDVARGGLTAVALEVVRALIRQGVSGSLLHTD